MSNIAQVGEVYVLYRLLAEGYEAYRTSTGFATVDLRVVGPKRFDVQVKTATTPSWQLTSANNDDAIHVRRDLYFVLVEFHPAEKQVKRSLVLKSAEAHTLVSKQHDAWLERMPKGKPRGRYIKECPVRGVVEPLDRFVEAWGRLPR
jgi:hypothetical protein